MHCFTYFNKVITEGILTVFDKQEGNVVELGAPYRGRPPLVIRRFLDNPPQVEPDGKIYEAIPGYFDKSIDKERKKIIRVKVLKDIFWHDKKILLRVNTSTIGSNVLGGAVRMKLNFRKLDDEDGRKPGGWDIKCGNPEDWSEVPVAFERATNWSDDIVIMHHGDAIIVNPQWGDEEDRVVIFDSFGTLHMVTKQDFKRSLLTCGPELPEEFQSDEQPAKPFVVSEDPGNQKEEEEEEDPVPWPEEVVDYELRHPEEASEGDCEIDSEDTLMEVAECVQGGSNAPESAVREPQSESVP